MHLLKTLTIYHNTSYTNEIQKYILYKSVRPSWGSKISCN